MKSWILPSFLFVAAAGGLLATVVLYRENQALRAELVRRAETTVEVSSPAEAESGVIDPTPVEPPPPEPVAIDEVPPEPSSRREDRAARFRRMMDDPNVQAMIRERTKSGVEQRYAGLFRTMNLDEETIEVFKELMAERELVQRRAAIESRMGLGGDGPEAAFLAELEVEQLNQSLAEVLGEEDYDKFTYYQDTLPQRQVVEELNRRLSYSGTPLTEDRAEVLVGVMAGTEDAFTYTNDLSQLSGPERATLSAEEVALYVEERRVLNESVLSEASTVLESDQLEALAEQQIREIEALEQRATIGFEMRGFGPGGGRGPGGG